MWNCSKVSPVKFVKTASFRIYKCASVQSAVFLITAANYVQKFSVKLSLYCIFFIFSAFAAGSSAATKLTRFFDRVSPLDHARRQTPFFSIIMRRIFFIFNQLIRY